MSLNDALIQQLQKVLQNNVATHFRTAADVEKTPDKVKAFAQKQLDFFITGLAKESPELQKLWAKGHPYHATLRFNSMTRFYDVLITTAD
ncbi:MAG TPA: hypothetical protein VN963_00685 [bacterium]|nr:hypothetical protein [bacterium]